MYGLKFIREVFARTNNASVALEVQGSAYIFKTSVAIRLFNIQKLRMTEDGYYLVRSLVY